MSTTANFAGYSVEGFGQEGQERLLETAEESNDRGVCFVLSNSGVMYGYL